jgi:hypothetical protein
MELKNFITMALTSIIQGVTEAQNEIKGHEGALINPGGLTRYHNLSPDATWDHQTNNFSRLVSFDVAVTVEEGTKTDAKIGVVSGLFNLGAGGGSENKELAVSRIQFSVPILMPTMQAPEGAKYKGGV